MRTVPAFQLFHVLYICDLTWGSRQQPHAKHIACGRTPSINHAAPAFIENKRYRTNPRATGDMVNRNADFVYQTDQVFVVYSPRAEALVGAS
jgi:hypothetical protein